MSDDGMPATSGPSRAPLALALLIVVGAAVILRANANGLFFYDEWDFITRRRGLGDEALLGPHNGHLSIVPVMAYKLLLQVVGLEAYWPYRALLVLLHVGVVVLIYGLVRRRAGDAVALGCATIIMFLGAAGDDLLWAFQIGFVGSVLAGLVCLTAVQSESRRADVVAAIALAVSLGSSSIGVPIGVLVIVELAAGRNWARLLRVAAVPLLLYCMWRLTYGESDLMAANLDDAPNFAFGMISAAGAAMTGLPGLGAVGAAVLMAGFVVALASGRGTPRMFGLLAGALAFMGLTALARAQFNDPGATRYVYPLVVLLLLAAFEAWPRGLTPSRHVVVVGAGVIAIVCLGNLRALNTTGGSLSDNAAQLRGSLAGLELARARSTPEFQPAPAADPQVVARLYFSARDDFGSPVDGPIRRLGETERVAADRVLTELQISVGAAVTSAVRSCSAVNPATDVPIAPGRSVTVLAAKAQPVELRLRRFATASPPAPLSAVGAGKAVRIQLAADADPQAWQLRTNAPARICL